LGKLLGELGMHATLPTTKVYLTQALAYLYLQAQGGGDGSCGFAGPPLWAAIEGVNMFTTQAFSQLSSLLSTDCRKHCLGATTESITATQFRLPVPRK
jgi:hypothetical protein